MLSAVSSSGRASADGPTGPWTGPQGGGAGGTGGGCGVGTP